MRTTTRTTRIAALSTAGAAVVVAALAGASPVLADRGDSRDARDGLRTIGLTVDDRLVTFGTERARGAKVIGTLSGLVGDTDIVGIDYRVQDDLLYGVGEMGGIYRIDAATAVATKVSQLTVALQGADFGVDFNPAANALRVISDTGQNLRHPFVAFTGGPFAATTAVDGTLTYPATPTAAATVATGVAAAAYTNNDLDPNTGTSLFDIDTAQMQVVLQSPANAGLLAATGKLRQDPDTSAGFDIYSTIRRDRATKVTGYATLSVGGAYRVYEINLLNGEASLEGTFRTGTQVEDLAIQLGQK